ncbi:hypothetical protein CDAR_104771 [Caerostris darwini]|uniref:Uncharacterized protein n=1 Tax=Caerostris darwini TaxID=1538125 RepID=A0AAV4W3T9_9ARAC|nr:hypothetical protein CDAR_104771 [Caerostris darwini]
MLSLYSILLSAALFLTASFPHYLDKKKECSSTPKEHSPPVTSSLVGPRNHLSILLRSHTRASNAKKDPSKVTESFFALLWRSSSYYFSGWETTLDIYRSFGTVKRKTGHIFGASNDSNDLLTWIDMKIQ